VPDAKDKGQKARGSQPCWDAVATTGTRRASMVGKTRARHSTPAHLGCLPGALQQLVPHTFLLVDRDREEGNIGVRAREARRQERVFRCTGALQERTKHG